MVKMQYNENLTEFAKSGWNESLTHDDLPHPEKLLKVRNEAMQKKSLSMIGIP